MTLGDIGFVLQWSVNRVTWPKEEKRTLNQTSDIGFILQWSVDRVTWPKEEERTLCVFAHQFVCHIFGGNTLSIKFES